MHVLKIHDYCKPPCLILKSDSTGMHAHRASTNKHVMLIMAVVRAGLLLGSVDDVFVLVDKPKRCHRPVGHSPSLSSQFLDSVIEIPQGPPHNRVCFCMPEADVLNHFHPAMSAS